MVHYPSDVTAKLELAAVSALAASAPNTSKGAAWAYAARFDISLETDLTQRFPQLEGFDMGLPYKQLQNAMSKCPSNMLVYSGGPGSGKTTFALSLVRCLVNDDDFRAAWTVHSNELCDDACDKLHEILRGTGKKVFRVYPIKRMLVALKGKSRIHGSNPLPQNQLSSSAATAVANHVRTLGAADEKDHPLTRADSLVVCAMTLAQDDQVTFSRFTRLRERASLSKEDEKTLTDICYGLLYFALKQATVIVGTPVALGQIALKRSSVGKWQPTAIFADDIGRMPEAQFWIPIAFLDAKFVVATGDTRYFKPMSKSFDNHNCGQDGAKWRSTFGPQRMMSFLRRVEKAGALATHIYTNRRNIGGIADWAKKNIYSGNMNIAHGSGSLVDLFRNEFNRILRAKSIVNSFIIDIREGEEIRMGTSYTNQANRNYTFSLIFKMFIAGFPSTRDFCQQGTVMVIVPYTAQLYEYINDWKAYNVNDAMRSRVFFRTVEGSMSAEADVVIFDTVRTVQLGFVPNAQRMAVATTRARGSMVTLLSTKNWEKGKGRASNTFRHNHMISYYNYHADRQAVIDTCFRKNGWKTVCGICGLPDHVDSACTSTRNCKKCNVVHAVRFCPRGFDAVGTYDPNRRSKQ
ncbi:DNA helicase [Colletotrichum truncatum]|uniref:DNA helicase n=1 Tax=Colletotrichum truncatum TaxID=5467 RepID=A0ACC3ZB77_COLTU|nr:DNA helicase [Colletotrichum truncatum]KAF6796286.1 DNA helicase [Colletotrichum truncatum]